MSKVLVTSSKLHRIANRTLDIVGQTQGQTLDELATTLEGVNSEITTQEDIITRLQEAVESLPDRGSGGGGSVKVIGGKVGTAIPNSGFVEKIYINKDADIVETARLFEGLKWVEQVIPDLGNAVIRIYPIALFDNEITVGIMDQKFFMEAIVPGYWDELAALGIKSAYVISFDIPGTPDDIYYEGVFADAPAEIIEEMMLEGGAGWITEGMPDIVEINANAMPEGVMSDVNTACGLSNDLLSSILSITPFEDKVVELTGEYDGKPVVFKGGSGNKLPLPNTGTVDAIYFDTSLSIAKTVSLLEPVLAKLDAEEEGYIVALYFDEVNETLGLVMCAQTDGMYMIAMKENMFDEELEPTFLFTNTDATGVGFVGWNPSFSGSIDGPFGLVPEFGQPLGQYNDQLTELVYISDGKSSSSNEIDIEQYLANQRLPLKIKLDLPSTGASITSLDGTPIPATGQVNGVYINTALDRFEVCKQLKKINFPAWIADENGDFTSMGGTVIYGNDDFSEGLMVYDVYEMFRAEVLPDAEAQAMFQELKSYYIVFGVTSTIPDGFYGVFSESDNLELVNSILGLQSGWNNTPSHIDVVFTQVEDVIELGGIGAIGIYNDQLSGLFSTTPFEKKIDATLTGDYDGSSVSIDPTGVVPMTGYVDRIYFNTSLTKEQVIDQLTPLVGWAGGGINVSFIFIGSDLQIALAYLDGTLLLSENGASSAILTGEGWTENAPEYIDVKGIQHSGSGIDIPQSWRSYNDLWGNLISTIPFNKNDSVSINMKDYIDNKQIPLSIDISNVDRVSSDVAVLARFMSEYHNDTARLLGLYAMAGCVFLQHVSFKEVVIGYPYCFRNCGLISICFDKIVELSSDVFAECSDIQALIIKTGIVCTIGANTFRDCSPMTNKTLFVYVPDTLVDSYKSNANWSTYANQIKPLSELPQEFKDKYNI